MASVNTNAGAMVALQNLNKTNSQLQTVQNRINTGLAVSSAKDNGGIYAIAQNMRAEVGGLRAVTNSLDLAVSTVDVALAAGDAISDLLIEMKEKALAASDVSLDSASRTALDEDFKALRDQISTIVENAEFNGTNLIDGSSSGGISALANAKGTNTINVADEDMSLSGTILGLSSGTDIATQSDAAAAVTAIESALTNLNSALSRLGTGSKSLEIHKTFVSKLSDSLEKGIGNLVDADLAKESARLQSLQVKQQLGIQALSIANSAPSTVLGFFR
ncbi:flagellin [Glycocaulis albus]|uniref:Flagellin n=1 Tax=Glycocaulis albus TaxID=1382801 RepID=A0ABQ1XUD9_9PROT|nr:flagellin [Glycocaulis albus]MBV5258881.1 flagellin [Synechococcus moorigangaii CMS01]GGH03445.1 flagellin [Glycocaulis albus]